MNKSKVRFRVSPAPGNALNPDCPLGRHTGEGRYPAMKNKPRVRVLLGL